MPALLLFLFIVASCGEPFAVVHRLPRTLPDLLRWQGIEWYDVVTYNTSSIAVLAAFFSTTGINRATLTRVSGFSHHLIRDHLRGRHIIKPTKLADLMAALQQLVDEMGLDSQSRESLQAKIALLPAVTRVERVVAELHRNQERFALSFSQSIDVERVQEIRAQDSMIVAHIFAEQKQQRAATALPPVFKKSLAQHRITIADLRNYNTASAHMLVMVMRGVRLSLPSLSVHTGISRSNLRDYLQGKSTLRDKSMAKIEEFIKQGLSKQELREEWQAEIDLFFQQLNMALRVERAVLALVEKQIELRPELAETIQRVVRVRRTSLQLSAYGVTTQDVRHYRRSAAAVLAEILRVTGMSAHNLAIASGANKSTFTQFLKTRKLFKEMTLRKLEKFLRRSFQQQARLTLLRRELRRAFEVERAAQRMRADNIEPSASQKELLDRVARALA